MFIQKREQRYFKEFFNGVMHTTLNPEGPGVVRIHLVPPKADEANNCNAVAIINGQDVIPVNTSWSILLCEFIREVNLYAGKPVTEEDVVNIVRNTVKRVRKVYPFLSRRILNKDIFRIMNTFSDIAKGTVPSEDVEYINLGDYAPYMRAPHRMDLLVSSMSLDGVWHCNQKCIHCYAAGQPLAEVKELSTEEWKQIIDTCRDACIPQLTFTGGEPTLRKDLPELIDYASWFVTRLNTNGILLSPEYCKLLKEASLDSVQITFYSDNESIHNTLVGSNHYADTVSGIENAIRAGLNVSVNTPLCSLNKDYVNCLRFLHSKGIIYVTCSGLITTGNALKSDSEALQLSESEIKDVLLDAAKYCFENGMEINFTSPGWIHDKEFFAELGINIPSCGACLSNMAITPCGDVVPCQSWLSGDSLGNILTSDWHSIWNSDACVSKRDFSSEMLGLCPLRKGCN